MRLSYTWVERLREVDECRRKGGRNQGHSFAFQHVWMATWPNKIPLNAEDSLAAYRGGTASRVEEHPPFVPPPTDSNSVGRIHEAKPLSSSPSPSLSSFFFFSSHFLCSEHRKIRVEVVPLVSIAYKKAWHAYFLSSRGLTNMLITINIMGLHYRK